MSNLDNAIQSINTAADRTTKTTEFIDQWSTYDDQSNVTNPNNNVTVPSAQKQIKQILDDYGITVNSAQEAADSASNSAAEAAASAASAAEARNVTLVNAQQVADDRELVENVVEGVVDLTSTVMTNISITRNLLKFHPIY